jgi:uncharacterized Tic20 family protein
MRMDPVSHDERLFAMLCHLGGFATYFIPFGNIIVPLIIWLIKRETSSYVDDHGKAALNFQISMTIYVIIAGFLCILLIGIPILFILIILDIVLIIKASVDAYNGRFFKYPLSLRIFK